MSDPEGTYRSLQGKTDAFLEEFFEKGQSLIRELIDENDRLRAQLATANASPGGEGASGHGDLVDRLMNRVAVLERECDEIRRLAGSVEAESGDYRNRLETLESEHYNLACMFVAGMQFHSSTTVDDVMRTVTEILLNFVGVGKFTIFGVDERQQQFFALMREGGDPREVADIDIAEGPLADLMTLGRPWRTGDPRFSVGDELMTLPLVGGSRLMGVVRLESFLEQKSEFAESDSNLLGLVSEHGGIGIEAAWMRAHAKDEPLGREAVEHLVAT